MSVALGAGGLFFSAASHKDTDETEAETLLAVANADEIELPDVNGYVLNILCDSAAETLFEGDDTSPDELYRGAAMRNAHLESETGAVLSVTPTADFYTAAKNDILAGAYEYDLYAATATGGLSRLLSDGSLYDVSSSPYIDLDAECYDKKTNESLSLFGGKYLISSAASDARWWSTAVVFDKALAGEGVTELALDGGFTIGEMLGAGDLLYNDDDIYPLYFGVGGSFVRTNSDALEFVSLADFKKYVKSVSEVPEVNHSREDVFALDTLFDVRGSQTLGILPLPKASEYDGYGGYIDLSRASLIAIPAGSHTTDKTAYLVQRMAELSAEYVTPYFDAGFADVAEIYEIIKNSSQCDLSVLFGYGDMGSLVAESMRDDTRTTLEYYNRKALYEKALDIVAKRLASKNKEM